MPAGVAAAEPGLGVLPGIVQLRNIGAGIFFTPRLKSDKILNLFLNKISADGNVGGEKQMANILGVLVAAN